LKWKFWTLLSDIQRHASNITARRRAKLSFQPWPEFNPSTRRPSSRSERRSSPATNRTSSSVSATHHGVSLRVLTAASGVVSRVPSPCPPSDTDLTRKHATSIPMASSRSLSLMSRNWKCLWCTIGLMPPLSRTQSALAFADKLSRGPNNLQSGLRTQRPSWGQRRMHKLEMESICNKNVVSDSSIQLWIITISRICSNFIFVLSGMKSALLAIH